MGKPHEEEEEEGSWVLPGGGWAGPVTTWSTGPGSWWAWLGKTGGTLAALPGHGEPRFNSADVP